MKIDQESIKDFESRKQDHIRLSLDPRNEATGMAGFSGVHLRHEALPELDMNEVTLETQALGHELATPFLVSSMTAGHIDSLNLNARLAGACEERGWLMGVGSQRRELNDPKAANEWTAIRKSFPRVKMIGNIGLSQLIQMSTDDVERLVESLEASAMFVHLNALQEVIQPEGTPNFRGGLKTIENLVKALSVPVIVKETGCGFSKSTLSKLNETGIAAIDVSGFGGTHWGRIEGGRAGAVSPSAQIAETFKNWGVSTVESLFNAKALKLDCEIWASGGVRSGLDAAKAIALGANIVGFAKPILEVALEGEVALQEKMHQLELELKTALFVTGSQNTDVLRENGEVL